MSENQATTKEKQEKASSEELDRVLSELTADQIRFVVARQEHKTDKDAAESLEMRPNLISRWKHNGVPIDRAVQLMAIDGLQTALHVRGRNLAKAMLVKVAGLDSDDERLRQGVATEIIEWEMGKAMQPQRHEGTGEGGAITVQQVAPLTAEEKRTAMDGFYHRVLAETGTRDPEVDQPVEAVRATGGAG